MLPQGSPPWDHDHENPWLGRKHPRRAHSRTSIDRQLSQVKRPSPAGRAMISLPGKACKVCNFGPGGSFGQYTDLVLPTPRNVVLPTLRNVALMWSQFITGDGK